MLRSGTWRKGRKRNRTIPLAWIWVIVAMAVTRMVSGKGLLHPLAKPECSEDNKRANKPSHKLICNLKGDTEYDLIDFDWKDYQDMTINSNSSIVNIKKPYCPPYSKKVTIKNASKITTEQVNYNCSLQLFLENCKDVSIVSSVDELQMTESTEAEKVILPRVSSFRLQDSKVGELSLLVDKNMPIIKNSKIEKVTRLEIRVSDGFEMTDSMMDYMNGFIYNSTRNAVLNNVVINSVSSEGLEIRQGTLTFKKSKIMKMDSEGIMVMSSGQLKVENSEMGPTAQDAIVVTPGGRVIFTNVTIGKNVGVSFDLSDASLMLYPLSFFLGPSMSSVGWVAIGAFTGLAVGLGVGVGLTLYVQRRRPLKIPVDTNELLPREESTAHSNNQSLPTTHPPSINHTIPIPTPTSNNHNLANPSQANRPLPDVPRKDDEGQELYEEYSDVCPDIARQAQRPPAALPKEASSITSLSPGIVGQAPAKSTSYLAQPKRIGNIMSARKDDRDKLPPPPPPAADEVGEIYDTLDTDPSTLRPLPPPSANKPRLPFSRKPPPPPATGKPMKP